MMKYPENLEGRVVYCGPEDKKKEAVDIANSLVKNKNIRLDSPENSLDGYGTPLGMEGIDHDYKKEWNKRGILYANFKHGEINIAPYGDKAIIIDFEPPKDAQGLKVDFCVKHASFNYRGHEVNICKTRTYLDDPHIPEPEKPYIDSMLERLSSPD